MIDRVKFICVNITVLEIVLENIFFEIFRTIVLP